LSYRLPGGASPVLSKLEYPQCGHWEGFLSMNFLDELFGGKLLFSAPNGAGLNLPDI
jgi:hypothetical protein